MKVYLTEDFFKVYYIAFNNIMMEVVLGKDPFLRKHLHYPQDILIDEKYESI